MESKSIGAHLPPRQSRAEAKAQTRARVLEAAETVFRRDGYHGASLDRIAAEAGYTKGAVYSTFDSKADVMLALVAARAERRREEMRAIVAEAASIEDFIAEGSRRFAGEVVAERDWWAVVIEFMIAVGRDERLRARYAEHREATRTALADSLREWARRAGVEPAISPQRLATAMMSLNNGLTVEGLLSTAAAPGELFAEAQVALLRGALAPGVGAHAGDAR